MSSSFPARRGTLTALTVIAAAALFLLLTSGSAQALSPQPPKVNGNANFVIGAGKAGKVLKQSRVQVRKIAPARVARKGRNFVAKFPVRNVMRVVRTDVPLKGGVVFRKGKRAVKVRSLNLVVRRNGKVVVGGVIQRLGGKNTGLKATNLFRVNRKATVTTNGERTVVRVRNGKLSFFPGVARVVRKHLGLKRSPNGQFARFNLNAARTDFKPPVDPCVANPDGDGCPVIDPYLTECGVTATAKVPGSLPGALPLPVFADAKPTVGPATFDWGFKSSFRSYVVFGAGGSLKALDGAGTTGGPPVVSGFSFPTGSGQYAANDPADMTDDQAVLNSTGKAAFCATGHGFRVVVSNPTLVIDGDNSRVIADVDANLSGNWIPTQRVDLADLDLDGITPTYNKSGAEVTWGEIPATLTESGAKAICGVGAHTACSYTAGEELDPVNAAVETAYDTSDNDALATYVAANLPFPYPAAVGCEPQIPAGGAANTARTIDEHNSFEGTNYNWMQDPDRPAAQPDLSTGSAVSAGGFDWGVRTALRGTVNGTGEFNLSGGTTASNTPYVGNGPDSLPYPQANQNTIGQMAGPGKYFTWPAASSNAGFYDAGAPGDNTDDRLVLQTAGTVGFCNNMPIMGYGTVLSNPAIVIDGEDSRITVEVTTRFRLSWLRARVDFASIDLEGATFTATPNGGNVDLSWADAPAALTEDGARMVNVLAAGTYVEGAVLDPVTVKATVAE